MFPFCWTHHHVSQLQEWSGDTLSDLQGLPLWFDLLAENDSWWWGPCPFPERSIGWKWWGLYSPNKLKPSGVESLLISGGNWPPTVSSNQPEFQTLIVFLVTPDSHKVMFPKFEVPGSNGDSWSVLEFHLGLTLREKQRYLVRVTACQMRVNHHGHLQACRSKWPQLVGT